MALMFKLRKLLLSILTFEASAIDADPKLDWLE